MSALPPPRGVSHDGLSAALRACEEIAAKDRSNLYLVSQFLRDRRRYEAFVAMYAAMRVIDDLVDEAGGERAGVRREIDRWRERIEAAYGGEGGDDPLQIGLAGAVASFPVSRGIWSRFLTAMEHDLDHDRFDTPRSFLEYAEGATAAPTTIFVFLLAAAPVRDDLFQLTRDGSGFDYEVCGRSLGLFAYIAHILRDVASDLRLGERGRIYIPLSDLAACGLTEAEYEEIVLSGLADERWGRLVAEQVRRARKHEEIGVSQARLCFPSMEPDCRFILSLIIRMYQSLLRRIAENPETILSEAGVREPDHAGLIREASRESGYAPPPAVLQAAASSRPALPADRPEQSEQALEMLVRDPRFAEYVRLFNEGRFFEAHEVLESLWLVAPAGHKNVLQGLVQLAVALEHARRGNQSGARKVLARARRRLAEEADRLGPIDLHGLVRGVARFLEGDSEQAPALPAPGCRSL